MTDTPFPTAPAAPLAERQAPRDADWTDRYELVARVTSAAHCANFLEEGQEIVFDLAGRIVPERSTANLCLGLLARIQPGMILAADRAHRGVHPVSPGWQTFDCFDTGLDHGGMGKVCVRLALREIATGRIVLDAAGETASDS
ncbi:MAG: hypothetical protein GVY28_05900 [Alphaproteobacteria bacterium]|jgi:hypothetical protein|nr:hypothetical protein [Alphaproteobacteria bacterium]